MESLKGNAHEILVYKPKFPNHAGGILQVVCPQLANRMMQKQENHKRTRLLKKLRNRIKTCESNVQV